MKRPRIEPAIRQQQGYDPSVVWNVFPAVGFFRHVRGRTRRECPFCASWIKQKATVCPHCQRDLDDVPATTSE